MERRDDWIKRGGVNPEECSFRYKQHVFTIKNDLGMSTYIDGSCLRKSGWNNVRHISIIYHA